VAFGDNCAKTKETSVGYTKSAEKIFCSPDKILRHCSKNTETWTLPFYWHKNHTVFYKDQYFDQ